MSKDINLLRIKKSDSTLQRYMQKHYSQPRGFVGRQIIYAISVEKIFYGIIAAGSSPKFLPGRKEFFGEGISLNNLVNNTFFHIEKQNGKYPFRNFTAAVVKRWREKVIIDWTRYYGDYVVGYETLVELPRLGTLYLKDGWVEVGCTKGFTCKRVSGQSSDSWTGRRVWDTYNLRPKRVFTKRVSEKLVEVREVFKTLRIID